MLVFKMSNFLYRQEEMPQNFIKELDAVTDSSNGETAVLKRIGYCRT